MSIEWLPALVAGLIGTVVMSATMQMAASMGLTRMPAMHLVTGAMMSGDKATASRIGIMVHYIVMGTVVFGLAYAALFAAFDDASVRTGALLGLGHGLIVGLMAMPMMPVMHPRMSSSPAGPTASTVTVDGGQLALSAPGLFGAKWGGMTPVGLIVGHILYGVVVALVYSWLS